MAGLLSDAEAAQIREALAVFLVHVCTITPIVPVLDEEDQPVVDEWGNPVREPGTPVSSVPCKYSLKTLSVGDVRLLDVGSLLRRVPTITVAHDLAVSVGDEVSAITGSDGTVLLAGPAVVEQIALSTGFGPALSKRVMLRASGVLG